MPDLRRALAPTIIRRHWVVFLCALIAVAIVTPMVPMRWLFQSNGSVVANDPPRPLPAGTRVKRLYSFTIPKGAVGTIIQEWGTNKSCTDGYTVRYDDWNGGGPQCEVEWRVAPL